MSRAAAKRPPRIYDDFQRFRRRNGPSYSWAENQRIPKKYLISKNGFEKNDPASWATFSPKSLKIVANARRPLRGRHGILKITRRCNPPTSCTSVRLQDPSCSTILFCLQRFLPPFSGACVLLRPPPPAQQRHGKRQLHWPLPAEVKR